MFDPMPSPSLPVAARVRMRVGVGVSVPNKHIMGAGLRIYSMPRCYCDYPALMMSAMSSEAKSLRRRTGTGTGRVQVDVLLQFGTKRRPPPAPILAFLLA